MISSYAGFLYRLRRASDSATLDVGPATGSVLADYAAISTWAGGSVLAVVTIYDQSGNGKDLTAAATNAAVAFDLNQALAGCVPFIWDYQRLGGSVNPHMRNLALSLNRNNLSVADVVAPNTSIQDNSFWRFSDATGTSSVNYASLSTAAASNGGIILSHQSFLQFTNRANTIPRTNPDVIVSTLSGTGREIQMREFIETDATNIPTSQAIASINVGFHLNTSVRWARLRRWGLIIYPALSTADATTLRNRLISMFSVPTTFTKRIIFDGDSIMEGTGDTALQNNPAQIGLSSSIEQFNIAVHGQLMASCYSNRANRRALLLTTAYGGTVNNCLTVMEAGINEITTDVATATLQTTLTNYKNAYGYPLVVQTLLPWVGVDYTAGRDTERGNYNAFVIANSIGATGTIDAAADAVMGPSGAPNDTSLYVDGKHPTTTGYLRLAQSVYKPALSSLGYS